MSPAEELEARIAVLSDRVESLTAAEKARGQQESRLAIEVARLVTQVTEWRVSENRRLDHIERTLEELAKSSNQAWQAVNELQNRWKYIAWAVGVLGTGGIGALVAWLAQL